MPEFPKGMPKVPKVGMPSFPKVGRAVQPPHEEQEGPPAPPPADQPQPAQDAPADKKNTVQEKEKVTAKETAVNPAVNAIQAILESGTTAAQANLLLELTEHLAEGKAVSSVVSDVCRLLIAPGKANAVIKRLAYDAVQVASLHHNDWVYVCQGLQHDLSSEQTLEVQIRVLELMTMLPELHVELLLSNTDMEQKLLQFVRQGLPETQGAAAVAIAHCYSQPVIVRPLFSSPEALEKKMASWEMVADSTNDAVPRVVHGGLVAVSRMIHNYLDAKSAREAGQTSDLQTVLGLMAWAGAVRLRVAGAHVLDRMDAMPASLKVDSIAVLISTINLLMTQDPPPRLDAYGHLIKAPKPPDPDDPFPSSPTRLPTQPDIAPPVSDGWLFTAVGKFCLEYLQSPDSALAAEASRALLHLKWLHSVVKFPRLQVAPCPDEWARSAMSALIRVGEPLDAITAREAATGTICRYLCILPPTDVPAVAKTIIHWIAQRASGSSRVANLLLLWRAVVDTDLSVWKRAQAERLVPEELASPPVVSRAHANALVEVLELPLMRMLRAGEALEASPTLNQEVVATLFEVLLTHEDVTAAIDHALKSYEQSQVREGEADNLKACIESAAVLESRLTAVEWSQIALVALQGTQGCLGWDHKREKRQGTYPATLTSDKWFVLASRTQHVLHMLRQCEDLSEAEAVTDVDGAPLQHQGRIQLVQKLVDATHTLQGMFMKVLKFWRSLSPASTPRALWAIIHHLSLPAVQEAMWSELLEILRELLLYQPLATMEMHTQELEMSTRTGALPYSVGAQGLKARDRPLLFGGHLLHMPEAADWWDACSEGLAMGALALERIVHTLFNNFAEFSHIAGYQRLAHSIASILSQASISLPEAVGLHALCTRLTDVMESVLENLPEDPEDLDEDDMYKPIEDAFTSAQNRSEKNGEPEGGTGGMREAPKPPVTASTPDHAMTAANAGEGGPEKRTIFSMVRPRGGPEDSSDPQEATATNSTPPPGQAQQPSRPAPPHAPLGMAAAPQEAAAGAAAPGRAAPAPPAAAAAQGGAAAGANPSGVAPGGVAPGGVPPAKSAAPKSRSSNVLVSGAKGVGNALRLRRKGPAPAPLQSVHELHAQRKTTGGGAAAPSAPRAAPAPPPGSAVDATGRRHTFVPPTRAVAPAAPGTAGAAPTTPMTPGEPRANGRGPQRVVPRTYIGPILTPLKPLFPHAQEGFPFGAPVAITLADSVRAKRHIVFESQLTSSQQQIWEAYRDPSVRQDHSHTLANLLATVGTLPAPMSLARSIDPASVVDDAGACVMAVPGRFVELTSGHEALRLFACVAMDWAAMQIVLTFKAQSMIEQDMHALTVKVQAIGPAVFVGLSGWNIPKLAALECTSHSLKLAVAGSGAVVLQPAITHKVTLGRGGVERLEVYSAPMRVPITLQLKSPRIHLPADVYFQRFHTWHYSCTVSGTCKWPGASGGLAVLDIIEKKPFLRIYVHLLPAMGGFQAAYLAYDTTNRAVGLLVCAQLIFNDSNMSALTAEASDMAAASRCLFRIVAHTASSGAAASMRANPAHWLRELTDNSVAMSVGGGEWNKGEMVPLLSNQYAHAAVQYKKELTPDPEVMKQLQAKADAAAKAEKDKKAKDEEKKARKEEERKKKARKGGMADAGGAAKLAAFAKAAVAAQGTGKGEEGAAEGVGGEVSAEEDEAVVVQEQIGDDWLHTAVLSHWQMMRDASAAA